jgi:hypothetical protein
MTVTNPEKTLPGGEVNGKPAPFSDGWEPESWGGLKDAMMSLVTETMEGHLKPLNQDMNARRGTEIEAQLDKISPDWKQYQKEIQETLAMAPGLRNSPEKLLRASLPPEVFKRQAEQAAKKAQLARGEAANISGSSTTTQKNTSIPKVTNFKEAVAAGVKAAGIKVIS